MLEGGEKELHALLDIVPQKQKDIGNFGVDLCWLTRKWSRKANYLLIGHDILKCFHFIIMRGWTGKAVKRSGSAGWHTSFCLVWGNHHILKMGLGRMASSYREGKRGCASVCAGGGVWSFVELRKLGENKHFPQNFVCPFVSWSSFYFSISCSLGLHLITNSCF